VVNDVPPSHELIRFGAFELNTDSGELRKDGVKVRLQEQPLQILRVLVENPGKIVSREELQQRIWSTDTFVDFDRGLYNAIKRLREALDDSAGSPRFIETIPKRGYRLVAPVESVNGSKDFLTPAVETPAESGGARTRARGSGIWWLALAVVALLFVSLITSNRGRLREWLVGTSGVRPIHSLAVLPLQNLSGDPNQEYFSDGMTDALITEVAQLGSLKVISRTSSMQYKQTKKPLPQIARELHVDGIIEGAVSARATRCASPSSSLTAHPTNTFGPPPTKGICIMSLHSNAA